MQYDKDSSNLAYFEICVTSLQTSDITVKCEKQGKIFVILHEATMQRLTD